MRRNGTDRILPFRMYVSSISETPYYEIAFVMEVSVDSSRQLCGRREIFIRAIAILFQILAMYHAGMIYFCFDNFLCFMNIHAGGQFRILQRRLELLCEVGSIDDFPDQSGTRRKGSLNVDDNEMSMCSSNPRNLRNAEFKACILHHQSLIGFMKMVEDVYTLVVLSQVVIFSLLLCLTAYQAALVSHRYSNDLSTESDKT